MSFIYFCLFLNVDRNTLENYFHRETRGSSLGGVGEDFQLSGFMHTPQNPVVTRYEYLTKDSGDEEPGNELCIAEPRCSLNSNAWITL